MDIEERLKLLKKSRDLRRRTRRDSVEKTWASLGKDQNLSEKEKLEKLIHLTVARTSKPEAERPPFEPLPREPLKLVENSYPLQSRYGKNLIADGLAIRGETLYYLSKNESFKDLDLSSALFIDLETTGLAGGTGTLAFLVGMGYFRNGKFNIGQYFLGEPADEARMIEELAAFFREMDFQSVVTYNGKAFDLPLLETRFVLNRKPLMLSDLPHLDLLFSARSLWKHKHESCRLCHLAQEIVEAERAEDIPSAEIPYIYSTYLRSGDYSLIEPILYHNQEDLLSLLGLTIAAAKLFVEDREAEEFDAMDMIGVGKVFESAGDLEKSVERFERALKGDLPAGISLTIKAKLSIHYKRNADYEKAVTLWQDISNRHENPLEALRELAMYFEHKQKNYEEAKRTAEEGLALAMNGSASLRGKDFRKDFEHRLERLNDKIRRQGQGR
jgi:uncharacterized protein YprB with RNaseH-like and TPR domain